MIKKIALLSLIAISCVLQSTLCENFEATVENSFSRDFFDEYPVLKISNDTLVIEAILSSKEWHEVYFTSIAYRINHILDSLGCFDIRQKLLESKVKYVLHVQDSKKSNLAEFVVHDTLTIGLWNYGMYRNINQFLINTNPKTWYVSDMILEQLEAKYQDPIYNVTMSDFHETIISSNKLTVTDVEILKKVVERAKANSHLIDWQVLEEFLQLVPKEKEELIIEEQTPDRLIKSQD